VIVKENGMNQTILITGGTSGLGLELVHIFLRHGYNVVATGRQQVSINGFEKRFSLYNVDFSDLRNVSLVTRRICRDHSVRFIVNNAGILSPPEYIETINGLEYSFQINFLAHLLINNIILEGITDGRQIRIASVTSPVYRYAAFNPGIMPGSEGYRAMRSYSSSKLYLAMMSELLTYRHKELNLQCFSFDPGTFSSGIYRMQKRWFRELYRIAAPFMRNPSAVAKGLAELLLEDNVINGKIYDRQNRERSLPDIDKSQKASFMDSCYALIDPFLI
jgi:NAD(P)-dependent dehydrogenase (short-subunit alcohol dehydrogenase family)